jgi:hypothetical protein
MHQDVSRLEQDHVLHKLQIRSACGSSADPATVLSTTIRQDNALLKRRHDVNNERMSQEYLVALDSRFPATHRFGARRLLDPAELPGCWSSLDTESIVEPHMLSRTRPERPLAFSVSKFLSSGSSGRSELVRKQAVSGRPLMSVSVCHKCSPSKMQDKILGVV